MSIFKNEELAKTIILAVCRLIVVLGFCTAGYYSLDMPLYIVKVNWDYEKIVEREGAIFRLMTHSIFGLTFILISLGIDKQLSDFRKNDYGAHMMSVAFVIWIFNGILNLVFGKASFPHLDSFDLVLNSWFSLLNTVAIMFALKFVFFRPEDTPIWINKQPWKYFRDFKWLSIIGGIALLFTILLFLLQEKFYIKDITDGWLVKPILIPVVIFNVFTLFYLEKLSRHVFKIREFSIFHTYFVFPIVIIISFIQIKSTLNLKVLVDNPIIYEYIIALLNPISISYLIGMPVFFFVLLISWHHYIRIEKSSLLIRDMHHTIKNSLTILEGDLMLSINPENEIYLSKNINRIQAIKLLHSYLHDYEPASAHLRARKVGDKQVWDINLIEYLKKVNSEFKKSYGLNDNQMKNSFIFDTEIVWVFIDKAKQIGRIVCELNTNSVKNFPKKNKENLILENSYEFTNNNKLNIMIKDNGVGLPYKYKKGFGLLYIFRVVKHLKGNILSEQNEIKGTTWIIKNLNL